MANNKNLESIDEIFRKTFSELPETPAANGWDAPSDHVWQQVQTGIQTRHNTWSNAAKIMGLISISVAVAAGVYFLSLSDKQEVSTLTAPVIQEAAQPTLITAPKTTATLPVAADKSERKKVAPDHTPKAEMPAIVDANSTVQIVKNAPQAPNHAPAHVEDKSAIPNVVERRKQVKQIKSSWGKYLHTLPAQRKGSDAPAVPLELKNLAPNNE